MCTRHAVVRRVTRRLVGSTRRKLLACVTSSVLAFAFPSLATNAALDRPAYAQPRSDGRSPRSLELTTTAAEPVAFPVRIDAIRIRGLSRTSEHVVRREVGFSEGEVISEDDLDLALTRLWNTTIFAHVQGQIVEERQGFHAAVFDLEDRWTLNPLLSFGSGGGALFVRAGATDNNIAGRFLEAYALYENFNGFHGGQLILRDPRLLDRRTELALQGDRLIRPRPGYADQRTQGAVEVAQLGFDDYLRVGMRVSVFADRFLEPLDTPPMRPMPTNTLFVEPRFRLGRIDTVRVRQRGSTFEIRPGVGFASTPASAVVNDAPEQYATLTGEVLAFWMPGKRWNVAFRGRAATMTRAPGPHLELFAGGLDLVRGFPDNFIRTRAMTLATIELRFVAFDSKWVALLPTTFVDAIAARAPSGSPGAAISAGGGVRVIVPQFVASGVRLDLAVPLASSMRVMTEDDARFGPVTPTPKLGSIQPSVGIFQFF